METGRHSAVAFVIGDYAYVGTGYVTTYSGATSSSENRVRKYFKDFIVSFENSSMGLRTFSIRSYLVGAEARRER